MQRYFTKIFSLFSTIDKQSVRREFKHAFSMGTSKKDEELTEKENILIAKLVTIIEKRRLIIPARMFLESVQPLNYIGSQIMVFFRPFITFFFSPKDYDVLQGILEKRSGIKRILDEMEKRG